MLQRPVSLAIRTSIVHRHRSDGVAADRVPNNALCTQKVNWGRRNSTHWPSAGECLARKQAEGLIRRQFGRQAIVYTTQYPRFGAKTIPSVLTTVCACSGISSTAELSHRTYHMSRKKWPLTLASKAISRRDADTAGKALWTSLSETGRHLEYRTECGERTRAVFQTLNTIDLRQKTD